MYFNDFYKLTFRQQDTLIIAMNVRNALEKFHGRMPDGSDGFITDEQMKLLNQTIRIAIFEALFIRDKVIRMTSKEKQKWVEEYDYLIMCIPNYWEIPNEREYLAEKKKFIKTIQKKYKSELI